MKLVHFLFLSAVFVWFLLPPIDPDLGWQLRCGQTILAGRGFCSRNEFSVFLPDYRWTNHDWLYQAVLYPIHQLAGFPGLIVVSGLVAAATFGFFYFSTKNRYLTKIITLIIIGFFSWGVFALGIRSQLLGLLFFNLILFLYARHKLVYLPLVTLLWANSHGSFVLGVILVWGLLLLKNPQAIKRSDLLIGALATLTTLVNPFGINIYAEAWRHFAGLNLGKIIAEWVPPPPLLWWGLLVGVLLVSAFKKTLLLLPFLYLALSAGRHVPYTLFLAGYLLLKDPPAISVEKPDLAIFVASSWLLWGLIVRPPATTDLIGNYCLKHYLSLPCPAIQFLKAQPDHGNLFNRYEWGGYLIWQLPEYPLFVDGRMSAWDTPAKKSPYTIYLETLQNQPGWEETLSDANIQWILISPNTFMDLLLAPDPAKYGWQEVFRDRISVVYKKRPNKT